MPFEQSLFSDGIVTAFGVWRKKKTGMAELLFKPNPANRNTQKQCRLKMMDFRRHS